MKFSFTTKLFACFLLVLGAILAGARAHAETLSSLNLDKDWRIQSSAKVKDSGELISLSGYADSGWIRASVPSTVLNALVDNRVYPDPYFGMNLAGIPGMDYKRGENFSNIEMPGNSPFFSSWWYRVEFKGSGGWRAACTWLNVRGLNYKANIWLNGHQIASSADTAGAFRRYEIDVSKYLKADQQNALAFEIFPPAPDSLAFSFVDWNPMPPDKDMGLWDRVSIAATGPVVVRHPNVDSKLDRATNTAELTVYAQVVNATDREVTGALRITIDREVRLACPVKLARHESKTLKLSSTDYPQLKLRNPALWWPYQMGEPILHDLKTEFVTDSKASDSKASDSKASDSAGIREVSSELTSDGARLLTEFVTNTRVSDSQVMRFGIREVSSEITSDGARLFKINGKKILIRGAGYSPDMMLKFSPERWAQELAYVKDMNLNTVRLEGKLMPEEFLDMTDRLGILVMAGWCCCDHFEKWDRWHGDELKVAAASLEDQTLRLRKHPSVFVWLNGSDFPPPPDVEKEYLQVLRKVNWSLPVISSATGKPAASGPTGVKMSGPYDYVPPAYWLKDTGHGGAFGFNTETGPGPAIPPVESLKRMLGDKHLWPPDDWWTFHAGGGQFASMKIFDNALAERYGKAKDLNDYVWKAQAMAYEGERAMFEAYAQNKYRSTGVIQWMLNNAWPSLIWHLYDYYLRPGAGYFGTKKACEPVHVQYSYSDHGVVLVNQTKDNLDNLTVEAFIYDVDGAKKHSLSTSTFIPPDSSVHALDLPAFNDLATYFLQLRLTDSRGKLISSNVYWLSSKEDELDWEHSNWFYTPQTSFADLTALSMLPPATLEYKTSYSLKDGRGNITAQIENPGKHIAFLTRLKVTRGKGGEEILPALWEDNYVTLFPGESRSLCASFDAGELQGKTPAIEIDGWNVAPVR